MGAYLYVQNISSSLTNPTPSVTWPLQLSNAQPRAEPAPQHPGREPTVPSSTARTRVEVANEGNTDGRAGYWANSAKGAGSLGGDVSVQEQTLCSYFIFLI